MKAFLPLTILLASVAPAAFADTTPSTIDSQVLGWVHAEDTMQLADVPLVTGHTTNADVVQFAQMISDDQKAIETEASTLATSLSIDLDARLTANADIAAAITAHTTAQAAFKDLTGDAFDQAFLQHAISDNTSAITELTTLQASVTDDSVNSLINDQLAAQEEHMILAELLLLSSTQQ